jgi:phosphatidylserine decarboxylase
MSVGHSPDIPQFEPDMPKKAENITAEEMQDAKRRIEGSLAPSGNPSTLMKTLK